MSTIDLQDHREHIATLDKSQFLGSIVWTSLSATSVPYDAAKVTLEAHGLADLLPSIPADSDVFRRTFSNGVRRKLATDNPDVHENLLVRQVTQTSERIVKRIVSELVDAQGETLAYEEAVDVCFSINSPERIELRPHVDERTLEMNGRAFRLANDLRTEYIEKRNCLNSDHLRNIIRRQLDRAFATAVRPSGGVYFVLQDHVEKVDILEAAAALIPGCAVHSLPLLDDRKQRDMIRAAFESESVQDLEKLIAEMDDTLALPEVSERKFVSLQQRFAGLRVKGTQYSQLMAEHADTENFRLKLATTKMGQLFRASMGE